MKPEDRDVQIIHEASQDLKLVESYLNRGTPAERQLCADILFNMAGVLKEISRRISREEA